MNFNVHTNRRDIATYTAIVSTGWHRAKREVNSKSAQPAGNINANYTPLCNRIKKLI